MGVIHKLKDPVVEFILSYKKENPSASVRHLAEVTTEKFQMPISKSSVGAALKSASLSSGVGRPTGSGGRQKKFFIPEAKKKEISSNFHKAGYFQGGGRESGEPLPTEGPPSFLLEKDEPTEPPRDNPAVTIPEESSRQDAPSIENIRVSETDEHPGEKLIRNKEEGESSFLASVLEERDQKKRRGVRVARGMGFIFLKAAELEISRRPFMMTWLEKCLPENLKNLGPFVDLFALLRLLGLKEEDPVAAYRGHGAWVLSRADWPGESDPEDLTAFQQLFRWTGGLRQTPATGKFILEYMLARDQSLTEVQGFQVRTEDGASVFIDAMFDSFSRDMSGGVIARTAFPLEKAIERVSRQLISNMEPAVFYKIPGESQWDPGFFEMVALFENVPAKRMRAVTLIGVDRGSLAEFTLIPSHKRRFLVGISPQQKEFSELIRNVKWAEKKQWYHRQTDQIFYYTETQTKMPDEFLGGGEGALRLMTIWRENEKDPCWGILTNDRVVGSQKLVSVYFDRWPYLEQRSIDTFPPNHAIPQGRGHKAVHDFSEIFDDFVGFLHTYCLAHYFPPAMPRPSIDQYVTDVYGLPGIYDEGESSIIVTLEAPQSLHERLAFAVERVNERHVQDSEGRRIWLRL